jgi:hypothetical protein
VIDRRDRIETSVRHFAKVLPLDDIVVRRAELTFVDLAVPAAIAGTGSRTTTKPANRLDRTQVSQARSESRSIALARVPLHRPNVLLGRFARDDGIG